MRPEVSIGSWNGQPVLNPASANSARNRNRQTALQARHKLLALACCWALSIGCTQQDSKRTQPLLLERTQASGLNFVHVHGGIGKRELPETMGGGVAVLDYDRDGDLDLAFSQSGHVRLPGEKQSRKGSRNSLWAGDGRGKFKRVQAAAGSGDPGYGQGIAAGDVNGDGYDDLYSLNWGPNTLYVNRGGRFQADHNAGLVPIDEWSIVAAFFDSEGDGDLDIYLVNYVVSPPSSYIEKGAPDGYVGYPHPDQFEGQADRFYVNSGRGTFEEQTREAGLYRPSGKGLGVVPTDIELDGLVDLYVSNDSTPNFLFHNLGANKFEELGSRSGTAFNRDGRTEAGMGVDSGDFDNDEDFDIFVTNLSGETNSLYLNNYNIRQASGELRRGAATFQDATTRSGLSEASFSWVGFGTLFNDLDGDGDLDLLVANGHVLDNAGLTSDHHTYAQPNQLFLSNGRGRWELQPAEQLAPGLELPTVSRGLACGDLDSDGDLDYVFVGNNSPAQLFLGNIESKQLLSLSLQGPPGNPHGLGAAVWLKFEDGHRSLFRIESARSYASSCSSQLTVGVPQPVREVEVLWPGGARERWENLEDFEGIQNLRMGSGQALTSGR